MENWIFCFVFLVASSLNVPAANDVAEIAVMSTTRHGMNNTVIILAGERVWTL